MAAYSFETIFKLIEDIDSKKVILPAMQRNFVWSEEKICKLFDSLMRDYPIGTFLFWNIKKNTVKDYVFNEFISNYNEKNRDIQRGKRIQATRDEYISVLDGQQRITSLYIGIKGEYITHIKGRRRDLESSYVKRYLSINILHTPDEDNLYSIKFIEKENIGHPIENEETNKQEFWVKIADIFSPAFDGADYFESIEGEYFPDNVLDLRIRSRARKMLVTLHSALFEKNNVNFYPAEDIDLFQVVDIFVRVNSGGQKLSAPDLMLSIATGQDGNEDIQVKMQDALDKIASATNSLDTGFQADKELILIAGLLFTGAASLSLQKKENYSRDTIKKIMDNWDAIIDSIYVASRYIDFLGFNGLKLTSKNLILPVAYYFYKNSLDDTYKNKTTKLAQKDRIFIRQWLLRAMINSIFRDGTGTTLKRIRDVIDANRQKTFPLKKLIDTFADTKRSLIITDDTIDEMFRYQYGDSRIAPLFLEISKGGSSTIYDIDHIWPKSKLLSKKELDRLLPDLSDVKKDEFKKNCHYLANLELLPHQCNIEKGDQLFDEWLCSAYSSSDEHYFSDNCIPQTNHNFEDFIEFLTSRKKLLKKKIKEALPKDFNDIITRYGLE